MLDVIITRGGKTIKAIVVGDARKYSTVLLEPSTTAVARSAELLAERLSLTGGGAGCATAAVTGR
ncbi:MULTISPECIES: hypothetical protein [unclassified Streptomyces]|uniref:hypothetical protein n=1 Tax=unclassified Streptomyces TaxID=2593676 RepID=UPI00336A7E41